MGTVHWSSGVFSRGGHRVHQMKKGLETQCMTTIWVLASSLSSLVIRPSIYIGRSRLYLLVQDDYVRKEKPYLRGVNDTKKKKKRQREARKKKIGRRAISQDAARVGCLDCGIPPAQIRCRSFVNSSGARRVRGCHHDQSIARSCVTSYASVSRRALTRV